MSLPFSSTMANVEDPIVADTSEAARVLVEAVKADLKPRDIVTRKSIENAVSVIMATGGSTNVVLHFLAIAHAAGVEWTSSCAVWRLQHPGPVQALVGRAAHLHVLDAVGVADAVAPQRPARVRVRH